MSKSVEDQLANLPSSQVPKESLEIIVPTDDRAFNDQFVEKKSFMQEYVKDPINSFMINSVDFNPFLLGGKTLTRAFFNEELEPLRDPFLRKVGLGEEGDPYFDPLAHLTTIEQAKFAEDYIGLQSEEEVKAMDKYVSELIDRQKIAAESPMAGIAGTLVGGAADPIMLLTAFGGSALTASKMGTKFRTLKNAAGAAASFSAGAGASTYALEQINPLIEDQEKYHAMIAGAVFGGILGTISPLVGKESAAYAQLELQSISARSTGKIKEAEFIVDPDGKVSRSAGAAQYEPFEAKLLDKQGEAIARAVTGPRWLRGPLLNGALSKLRHFNTFTRRAWKSNLKTKGAENDNFIPAQVQMEKDLFESAKLQRSIEDLYLQYRGKKRSGVAPLLRSQAFATKEGQIKFKDFDQEVALHAFRKERHFLEGNKNEPAPKHAIPEVEEAAELLLKKNREIKERAVPRNLLDKDAPDVHMPRRHLKDKWKKLSDKEVDEIATEHYNRNPRLYTENGVTNVQKAIKFFRAKRDEFRVGKGAESETELYFGKLGVDESGTVVRASFESVTPQKGSGGAQFLKGRDPRFDSEILAKHGLIQTSAIGLEQYYLSAMSRSFALRDILDSMKFEAAGDMLNDAAKEAAAMMRKVDSVKEQNIRSIERVAKEKSWSSIKTKAKIKAEEAKANFKKSELEADLKELEDSVLALMGKVAQRGPNDHYFDALRKLTMAAVLGGILISSIPDLMSVPFRQGFKNVLKDGWLPMVKDAIIGTNGKRGYLFTANKEELNEIGVALDLQMNHALKMLVDPDFNSNAVSAFGGFNDAILDIFGRVTGISYWNVYHKTMAGQVAFSRIIKTSLKKKLSDKDLEMLKDMGITKKDLAEIKKNYIEAGGTPGDIHVVNIKSWKDKATRDRVAAAIQNEVDSSVLTPQTGDIPLIFQRSTVGRLAGQFKSFSSTAQTRMLVSGLQRRDLTALLGMSNLIMMGYTSYAIKEILKGKEPETDLGTIISEGIARSGITSLFLDYAFILNPWSSSTRYSNLDLSSMILGPSFSVASKAYKGFTGVLEDGQIDREDLDAMRKATWFQNFAPVNKAWEQVLKNIPEKNQED